MHHQFEALRFSQGWLHIQPRGSNKMNPLTRDGNLYPTRRYPAWPNPNGLDFTWPNKLQGRVWVLKIIKKNRSGFGSSPGFMHTQPEHDPYTHNIKKSSKPQQYKYSLFLSNFIFLNNRNLTSQLPPFLSLNLSPLATLLRPQMLPSPSRPHSASQPHNLVSPHAPLTVSLHLAALYLFHSHSRFFSAAPHPVTSLSFTHQPTLHSHHVVVVLSTDLVLVKV